MGKSWTQSSSTSPSHGSGYNSELRRPTTDGGKNYSSISLYILRLWQHWPLEQRYHSARFTLVPSLFGVAALEISSLARTFQLALALVQPGRAITTLDRMQEHRLVIQTATRSKNAGVQALSIYRRSPITTEGTSRYLQTSSNGRFQIVVKLEL